MFLEKERPAMRRVVGEALMSAGTVAVLLIALVAFDDRVRERISQAFMAQPSLELASAGHHLRSLTSVIVDAARDHSLAIEPDRRQAAHLTGVVRQKVAAELILAETTEGALDAIGNRVPDMVLVPAL